MSNFGPYTGRGKSRGSNPSRQSGGLFPAPKGMSKVGGGGGGGGGGKSSKSKGCLIWFPLTAASGALTFALALLLDNVRL